MSVIYTHFLLTGEMLWEHPLLPSLVSTKQPQTQTTSPSSWVNISQGFSGTSQASRSLQHATLAPLQTPAQPCPNPALSPFGSFAA